jgi:hypothetical protein
MKVVFGGTLEAMVENEHELKNLRRHRCTSYLVSLATSVQVTWIFRPVSAAAETVAGALGGPGGGGGTSCTLTLTPTALLHSPAGSQAWRVKNAVPMKS